MSLFLSRRQMVAALALAPAAAVLGAAPAGSRAMSGRLARAAIASGRQVGAAVRWDRLDEDPALAALVIEQSTSITPEFSMNWNQVEPRRGHWQMTAADGIADFARANGLALRGHTLFWDLATPAWARRRLRRGDWATLARHIEVMTTRYPDVVEWEVVNEAIDTQDGEDGYRRTSAYRGFGPDYITRAFAEARRHAPAARLILNDYSLEYDNPIDRARRAILLRMAETLTRRGLLDAVGLQAHLDLSKGGIATRELADFTRQISELGLDVVITELDVKEADRSASIDERDGRVADEVAQFLAAVLSPARVTGITTWGLTDRDSWLQDDPFAEPTVPHALNRGLPYDWQLRAKPMADALEAALRTHLRRATASSNFRYRSG